MPNPSNHLEEGYTYVRGYVRRNNRNTNRESPSIILFILVLVIIGIAIWVIQTYWVWISLAAIVAFTIFVILKWKKWKLVSIFLGIIGLTICMSIFVLQKEPSSKPVNAVQVDKLTGGQTLGSYQAVVQVEPTTMTKVGQQYLVKLDNGITTLEYKVSWNQLEINIKKVKTIANTISQDETTAWNLHPNYKISTYELLPKHNPLYILLGIAILALFLTLAIYVFPRIFYEY